MRKNKDLTYRRFKMMDKMIGKYDVSIVSDIKDIQIKYGESKKFDKLTESCISSVKYILSDLSDIKRRYISLGFHLLEFDLNCYYMEFGFDNIFDFCEKNFGFDKSFVSRCMAVCRKFSLKQESGKSMFIDPKYKDYSYSQLCEMVSIKDPAILSKCKPELSVKEIRSLKKNKNNNGVATSQQIKHNLCTCDFLLHGAARIAKFKKVDPLSSSAYRLTIFDKKSGKFFEFYNCELLLSGDNRVVYRTSDFEDLNHAKK